MNEIERIVAGEIAAAEAVKLLATELLAESEARKAVQQELTEFKQSMQKADVVRRQIIR